MRRVPLSENNVSRSSTRVLKKNQLRRIIQTFQEEKYPEDFPALIQKISEFYSDTWAVVEPAVASLLCEAFVAILHSPREVKRELERNLPSLIIGWLCCCEHENLQIRESSRKVWEFGFRESMMKEVASRYLLGIFQKEASRALARSIGPHEETSTFYTVKIKSMIIQASRRFLESPLSLSEKALVVCDLIGSIPTPELFEYELALSIITLVVDMWTMGCEFSLEVELSTLSIVMALAQESSEAAHEAVCLYVLNAIHSASSTLMKSIYYNLEVIVENTGLIGSLRGYFVEVLAAFTAEYGYDAEKSSILISKLFLSKEPWESHFEGTMQSALSWLSQHDNESSSYMKHLSGIFHAIIFRKSMISHREISFLRTIIEAACKITGAKDRVRSLLDRIAVNIHRKHFEREMEDGYPHYITGPLKSFEEAERSLLIIAELYFSLSFAPSEDVLQNLVVKTVENAVSNSTPSSVIKRAALATLMTIQKNFHQHKEFSRIPNVAAKLLIKTLNGNDCQDKAEIRQLLFTVLCFNDFATQEYLTTGVKVGVEEVALGLLNNPSSVPLMNHLLSFVEGLNTSLDISNFADLLAKLNCAKDVIVDRFLTRALELGWDETSFSCIVQFLDSSRHAVTFLSSTSWRDKLAPAELFYLQDKNVITSKSVEALVVRVIDGIRSATMENNTLILNLDLSKSSSMIENMDLFRNLIPLLVRNLGSIDLEYLVQLLPFGELCHSKLLEESIISLLEHTSFVESKRAVAAIYDEKCSSWISTVFHVTCKLISNDAWHCAIASFIWTSITPNSLMEDVFFPPMLRAPSQDEEYLKFIFGTGEKFSESSFLKIVFALRVIKHAPVHKIDAASIIQVEKYLAQYIGADDPEIHRGCTLGLSALIYICQKMDISNKSLIQHFLQAFYNTVEGKGMLLKLDIERLPSAHLHIFVFDVISALSVLSIENAAMVNSRQTWVHIATFVVNVTCWVLHTSNEKSDNLIFDDLAIVLDCLMLNPFIQEHIRYIFQTSFVSVCDFLTFLFRFSSNFQLSGFLSRKTEHLFFPLMKLFLEVFLARGKALLNDNGESILDFLKSHVLRQTLFFPSKSSQDCQWIVFTAQWIPVAYLIDGVRELEDTLIMKSFLLVCKSLESMLPMLLRHKSLISIGRVDTIFSGEHSLATSLLTFLDILVERVPQGMIVWHNQAAANVKRDIEDIVDVWMTPRFLESEFGSLKECPQAEYMSLSHSNRTIVCKYAHENETIEISLIFPKAYPLYPVELCTKKIENRRTILGMRKAHARAILLQMQKMLNSRKAVLDALIFWIEKMAHHVTGSSPCPICCSVIHPEKKSIPDIHCGVCHRSSVRYHRQCILNWFKQSGSNTCPTCRSPWNSWKC